MKKIMAVYDEDPFYAERLSDYINRREDGIFSRPGLYIQEAAGGVCQGPWDRCAPYGNAVRRRLSRPPVGPADSSHRGGSPGRGGRRAWDL